MELGENVIVVGRVLLYALVIALIGFWIYLLVLSSSVKDKKGRSVLLALFLGVPMMYCGLVVGTSAFRHEFPRETGATILETPFSDIPVGTKCGLGFALLCFLIISYRYLRLKIAEEKERP